MPGARLVLHVGAMKSGTTYLQSLLYANRRALSRRGILLPGKTWRRQALAVHGLLHSEGTMWQGLADQVSAHEGTSVVSMEFLATATPEQARALRASVQADLEVVITARDLNRSMPAMWQETVQNGRSWTWEDYLDGILAHRPGHRSGGGRGPETGVHFWRQQNIVRMARTWVDLVGADRVHLVTVPHPGAPSTLLWERFASVVGTDPGGMEPPQAANESIGLASALALRELNVQLDALGLEFPGSADVRKHLLAKQLLAARRGEEPSLGLPVADWVVEHAAEMTTRLQRMGVRLVGDWADLAPVAVAGVHPGEVSDRQVADAALAGLAGVVAAMSRDDGGSPQG